MWNTYGLKITIYSSNRWYYFDSCTLTYILLCNLSFFHAMLNPT
jgi:hypothetical protein